jgi:mono/diheme cytochrome c family protein
MKLLIGIVLGVVLLLLAVGAVLATGSFDTGAIEPPSRLEQRVARWALDRSVARRAPEKANPLAGSASAAREGLGIYREQCLFCHGAPGVDPSKAGQGLNPGAPDLSVPRVQRRTDGQLFYLTGSGIRMTGMPAFSATHSEEELWKLVAALRRLPELTAEETALLKGSPAPAPVN